MKKFNKIFSLCLVIVTFICSFVTIGVFANEDSLEIFVEDYTVNAESNVIVLPTAYVYDAEDVGLTAIATVSKNGKDYPVTNGTFIADELGDYSVTYSAVNSNGDSEQKTITLTVIDELAPIVKTYAKTLKLKVNTPCSLPNFETRDFFEVEQKAYIVKDGNREVLEEEIIFADIFSATIEIVFTEKRENGLSTTVTYDLSVVNPGTIYGFNDLGETGAPYWVRAQAGQYTDPEKYQVPTLTMNEDANFVHDIDGKSFKVEIQGKEGMSNSNSWPRIDTSDISLPNLSEYEYLVAWIYNDSPDYKNITVHIQLNGSNSYDANVVCKRGEWTKLKISIKQLTSETGSSLVKKIAFWVSGFEDGSIIYYVDDLYLE